MAGDVLDGTEDNAHKNVIFNLLNHEIVSYKDGVFSPGPSCGASLPQRLF